LGLASLLSFRGIYRFIRFVLTGHQQGTENGGDRLRALFDGFEQLVGAGTVVPLAVLLAVVGLALLARHCRTSALVLGATGLLAVLMVYRGQSVHDVFAVRYFTTIQPALWIGLAALPVLAAAVTARVAFSAVLMAFCALQSWQCVHLDRWNDFKLWGFVRVASEFVQTRQTDREQFSCAPNVNLRIPARYYGLTNAEDSSGQAMWIMAFMHNRRSESELRNFLEESGRRGTIPIDMERTIALCKQRGHVLLRLDSRQIDVWEYDHQADRLRRLPDALRSALARAPSLRPNNDDRAPTIR
jgi:hypothetical protein